MRKISYVIDEEIRRLEEASRNAIEARNRNIFNKVLYYFKARRLVKLHGALVDNYEAIVSKRSSDAYRELEFIKETIESLYPTIAGAVGENSVVRELKKLSDDYYLINDFSLNFSPPIFNRRENDRIYSIQIDHLLVCQSGIFVIETKNWSAKSVENLDLRSPVEQIKRTSFALFVFLNSDKTRGLVRDHWGSKKIPIRSIIVMTNKAPKSDFRYVKVLPLEKLNGYIKYFDAMFSEAEVANIFNYLNHDAW